MDGKSDNPIMATIRQYANATGEAVGEAFGSALPRPFDLYTDDGATYMVTVLGAPAGVRQIRGRIESHPKEIEKHTSLVRIIPVGVNGQEPAGAGGWIDLNPRYIVSIEPWS